MSKDKMTTSKEAVETVEKTLDYCISTLAFWNKQIEWPTNLIYDALNFVKHEMKFISVSDSHIIDK